MERCDAELSLKRAHVNYGAALLRIYLFWLKDQKDIIRRIESFCSRHPSETGPVQGGISLSDQERILIFKESDPEYLRLTLDIERMQRILGRFSEREQEFIRLWFWNRADWQEICSCFNVEKSTLYYWRDKIALDVALQWEGSESPTKIDDKGPAVRRAYSCL